MSSRSTQGARADEAKRNWRDAEEMANFARGDAGDNRNAPKEVGDDDDMTDLLGVAMAGIDCQRALAIDLTRGTLELRPSRDEEFTIFKASAFDATPSASL